VELRKGKVRLSYVGRKAIPQTWSSNWIRPIAETSVGSWNDERGNVRRSKLTTVGSCDEFKSLQPSIGELGYTIIILQITNDYKISAPVTHGIL